MKDIIDMKQDQLDAGAKALWELIQKASAGAVETCNAGDYDTSAKLHQMAGLMQQAYGIGRSISGTIQAKSGGK